jgi:predicted O-methyltransferase YrrM
MTTGEPAHGPVLRTMGSWQAARVLMTANRLGIFQALGEAALTAEQVAQRCDAHPRSTAFLLNACVALGFLHKEGERYANTTEALEALIPGKPNYLGDAIKHDEWLWNVWTHLDEAIRTNRPVRQRAQPPAGPQSWREFSQGMHNLAMRSAPILAESLDLSDKRQLLDCGGGAGTYSIFLARRYPRLRAVVFDLPETIKLAEEVIAESGLTDRIATRAGNYFADDLGEGYDVVFLSAVLHSIAADGRRLLLDRCHRSLVSGGWLVVHEILIDPEGTSPLQATLFSLNMLVNNGEGRSYSGQEIMALMRESGFVPRETRSLLPPLVTSLVIGEKP